MKRMTKYQVAGVFFLLLTTVTTGIQLVDHGFEKIAVVISPDVNVNPLLLTALEDILTQASAALFAATKNQAYFREFIIVLPTNWPNLAHYETTLDSQVDKVDITVAQPNAKIGDNPYVNNPNACGEEGEYMHLTPNYILDDTIKDLFGSPGKLIVHEWSHLRWGVFDEYPYYQDDAFYPYLGKWYPTSCTREVAGTIENAETGGPCEIDSSTGQPAENCFFNVDLSGTARASLMFMQHITHVMEFCDNPETAPNALKHNRLAPNRQNRLCNYMSVWEVLRRHEDFISLSSLSPLNDGTDTRPNFRYVQSQSRKRVLVLDTSGSMYGHPLVQLRQAASSFIFGSVETGSQLGIVQFSSTASTLSELVQIDSDADKQALANALPNDASGGTSIGGGLLKGIEVLERNGLAAGGSIILITDGGETSRPYIQDVFQTVLNKHVTVHTIAIGQFADIQLAELSESTGGQSFFFSGSDNSTGFVDGLVATVAKENAVLVNSNVPLSILTEAGTVSSDDAFSGTFFIDSTIGRETTLVVTAEVPIDVEIESPLGSYEALSTTTISEFETTVQSLSLGNIILTGLWKFKVNTTSLYSPVTVNVQAKAHSPTQEILQIRSWLSRSQEETVSFTGTTTLGVYAEVTRGKTPVINASVIAKVETPMGDTFQVNLFDKGIGIDTLIEDGIYSARIMAPDLDGDGRYSVKANVVGTSHQTKVFTAGSGTGNKAYDPRTRGFISTDAQTEPLENFQRVTATGEFRITNYFTLTGDFLPPARITDFHLKSFNANENTATLEWTAVGGDMERGQASRYLLYVSLHQEVILTDTTSAVVLSNNQVLQGTLDHALPAGDREEVVVYIPQLCGDAADTAYLSVVAVDEERNQGEPSNMVIVSDAREIWQWQDNGSNWGSHSNVLLIAIFTMVSMMIWG